MPGSDAGCTGFTPEHLEHLQGAGEETTDLEG